MKSIRVAAVALCMLLLVLPSLAIPIFGCSDDTFNGRPVALPALSDGEGGLNADFDVEFEDWLTHRFAFRDLLVRLGAGIDYHLLRTSPNPDVIAGRAGWLYFAETAPDFTGEGRLTDRELRRIADNLGMLAEALEERDVPLYVAIVPNKSTIYPQYMPGRYAPRGDDGNIALLRDACANLPLYWIDLVTPLRDAAGGETPVYCRTDSHWNALGAAIAADVILKGMGREGPGTPRVTGDADFASGDLARLMGLPGALHERVPVVEMEGALPEADFSEHILRVEGDGDDWLMLFRDSFAIAAGPFIAQAFERTELRWESPLDAGHDCDIALLMIAERNLREYLIDTPYTEPDDDESDFEDDLPADEDFVPFSFDGDIPGGDGGEEAEHGL